MKNLPEAVYPILCENCELPKKEDLPEDLHRIHAIQYSRISVSEWQLSVEKIAKSLVQQQGFSARTASFNYPKHDTFKMNAPAVTRERLSSALSSGELFGWELEGSDDPASPNQMWIQKKFKFSSFQAAIDFVNSIAPICEALDHHPRWENVYDELLVRLSTFDADHKITELDLHLAVQMNRAAAK